MIINEIRRLEHLHQERGGKLKAALIAERHASEILESSQSK